MFKGYKLKDWLFIALMVACIAVVFLGIHWGDEYHDLWYILIPAGAAGFIGSIAYKTRKKD